MGTPFLSEIKLVSFNFAPKGWASCNGQILPINQNQPLFSLLGTTYGGNGQTTFALPNLQGRLVAHAGGSNNSTLGQQGGAASHTLSIAELPTHVHFMSGTSAAADLSAPTNAVLATPDVNFGDAYGPPLNLVAMNPAAISNVGGSQAHENMQPYLVLHYIIALQGVFPSPN